MNKSTITIERLEQLANFKGAPLTRQEEQELARMALAAMDSEPLAWGNGCDKTVPAALRYLAENERPIGGESSFNAAHLYQLAREIELMTEAPLYRHAQIVQVWIPVNERLPEFGDYLVTDGCDFDVQLFNGEEFIPGFIWEDKITHWMPLPSAPQEVKGE